MKLKTLLTGAALIATLSLAGAANAALTYVGSWEVDEGPSWTIVPAAYSGQEAAALLFGGSASDYTISTAGPSPAAANELAWVSTWGGACDYVFPCGTQVAEGFVQSTGGLYETPGDTSAYVTDWAVGSQYTNYAFTGTPAPEAATWALMVLGFGGLGGALRISRRRSAAVAA